MEDFIMISLKSKSLGFSSRGAKCFSIFLHQRQKSPYDVLEIAENASQAEVKSAYYKLSKKFHPDANINDPMATAKFQEISEAYEILGSDDSRLRYDKGMAPVSRMAPMRQTRTSAPSDPKAAFYKSRLMNKMNSPTTGRTYNFDEWTKSHYSATVISNRVLRSESNLRNTIKYADAYRNRSEREQRSNRRVERVLAYVVSFIIAVSFVFNDLGQHDVPRTKS